MIDQWSVGENAILRIAAIASLIDQRPRAAVNPLVETWQSLGLARVKVEGDAETSEAVYRRANLQCSQCHAIGPAGGLVA